MSRLEGNDKQSAYIYRQTLGQHVPDTLASLLFRGSYANYGGYITTSPPTSEEWIVTIQALEIGRLDIFIMSEASERLRFLDSLESPKPAAKPRVVSELNSYTTAEEKWLKQHYGCEFNFLRCNGWKIHDEEDRADGRRLVRAFMSQGDDTSETPEAAANDMTGNSAPLDAAEKQFMLKRYGSESSYVADYHWDFDDPHDIA